MKNYRDDFKVRFVNKPQYTIDEKKKTVKCYLTCDVIVPTGISGNNFMYNFRTFAKGYAKCDDKDRFNPEIGKKIALARAESKIYWKVRTEVNKSIRYANEFIKAGDKFVNKAYRVIDHNKIYIDKFTKIDKEKTRKILSDKAKAQPRDKQGRFTGCTTNMPRTNFERDVLDNSKCNSIKIKINRV